MGRAAAKKKAAAREERRVLDKQRSTVSVRGVRMGLVETWVKAHVTEQARRCKVYFEEINKWKDQKRDLDRSVWFNPNDIKGHVGGYLYGECRMCGISYWDHPEGFSECILYPEEDAEEEDTEEDLLPASPMSVNYLSPEKSTGEGFAAPEKVVECAASSKMKGRRIAMKTPCK